MFPIIPGPQGDGGGVIAVEKTIIRRAVTGTPAVGSTNNRIPRFNYDIPGNKRNGHFTDTDDAADGTYFSIVVPGRYFAHLSIVNSAATAYSGVRKGTALSNTLSVNETDVGVYPLGVGSSSYLNISGYIDCLAGDIIHGLCHAAPFLGYPGLWKFSLEGPF